MAVSDYIRGLREKVGHDLILLPGATAIIVDDATGRVLLQRRGDTGKWFVIGGGIDPGETAVQAAVREAFEETGLRVEATRLSGVITSPIVEYPNGDRCVYVTTTFRCRVVGGEMRADGEESLELAWFDPNELPPMREDGLRRIRDALPERGEATF